MGLISLPNVDEIAQERDPKRQMEMMLNTMGILMKNLSELNGYINSKNVKEITADKISAGTIDTNEVTINTDLNSGGYIKIDANGMTVFDGGKQTFRVDMDGHVTMTAATVQSDTGYPKVVMDPSTELFGAYGTAANYTTIKAVGSSSVPEMEFVNGVKAALIRITSTLFLIQSTVDFALATSGNMDLSAANVTINGVNFNSKANKSVATSPTTVAAHNHGFTSSDYIQCYDSAGVATVKRQWSPYSGDTHSHTQN